MEQEDTVTFALNERAFYEGHFGTIRYVGPLRHDEPKLEDTSGLWIGIEWDKNRGKHNGTVGGYKYFECEEGRGSLVRAQKLKESNKRISFVEALQKKYTSYSKGQVEEEEVVFEEDNPKARKKAEFVGMDMISNKQKELHNLRTVSLPSCMISTIDSNLSSVCPNIEELDVSENLLREWEAVAHLGKQLLKLEVLNVSANRFVPLSAPVEFKDCFSKLRVLVLNSCLIDWMQVEHIEANFPQLEELHLCENSLKSLGPDGHKVGGFLNLKLLNFEDNCIQSWNDVRQLSSLPKLEKLILNGNKLKKLECFTSEFLTLKSLLISNTEVNEWESLNQLNGFPSLTSLRFSNTPLISSFTTSTARLLIIARIEKLTLLNGSEVRPLERTESEKFYLKFYYNDYNSNNSNFSTLHPRYSALLQLHGAPYIEQKEAQTLAEEMINVTLTSTNGTSAKKRMPLSLTVGNLKALCHRLFKLDPSAQKLYYKPSKDVPIPDELNDESQTLSYYGIRDNAEILVEANS